MPSSAPEPLPDAAPAEDFARLFAGASHPIRNLRCQVEVQGWQGTLLPITFADRADAPNLYLCCPSVAYRDYGIEETRAFTRSPALRAGLVGLMRAAGPLLRATGLDHQVQVNNWLLSTNPPPPLAPDATVALMQDLAHRHPDRAVVIRSLNHRTDAAQLDALRGAGAALLPARQVWLWQPGTPPTPNRRWDQRLLARSPLEVVGAGRFSPADFDAAAELYAMLYLRKYTPLNPDYSADFLRGLWAAGLLNLRGLRGPEGLVAVLGTVRLGGLLTAPIVGYRTDLPQEMGLYRMLIALAMDEAEAAGLPFNISAGAAQFKRLRGARPAIEYTAALVSRLPRGARAATALLSTLLTRIGVPLMERYRL